MNWNDGSEDYNIIYRQKREIERLTQLVEPAWSSELPTKPGHYWFFGLIFGLDRLHDIKPRYEQVELVKVSNGTLFTVAGAFLDEPQEAIGFWTPNNPPLPPKVFPPVQKS
jgi:hypothetical protein